MSGQSFISINESGNKTYRILTPISQPNAVGLEQTNLIPATGQIVANCTPTANGYSCKGLAPNLSPTFDLICSQGLQQLQTCLIQPVNVQNFQIASNDNGQVNIFGILIVLIITVLIFMSLAKK